ncbi:hypothetical protein C4546_03605 [Candidatus Parcubacteria bacterium]|nr:MAG: hypothetical protein C4546_03605 [Candidatus Parcubacteria bacterium]
MSTLQRFGLFKYKKPAKLLSLAGRNRNDGLRGLASPRMIVRRNANNGEEDLKPFEVKHPVLLLKGGN